MNRFFFKLMLLTPLMCAPLLLGGCLSKDVKMYNLQKEQLPADLAWQKAEHDASMKRMAGGLLGDQWGDIIDDQEFSRLESAAQGAGSTVPVDGFDAVVDKCARWLATALPVRGRPRTS